MNKEELTKIRQQQFSLSCEINDGVVVANRNSKLDGQKFLTHMKNFFKKKKENCINNFEKDGVGIIIITISSQVRKK